MTVGCLLEPGSRAAGLDSASVFRVQTTSERCDERCNQREQSRWRLAAAPCSFLEIFCLSKTETPWQCEYLAPWKFLPWAFHAKTVIEETFILVALGRTCKLLRSMNTFHITIRHRWQNTQLKVTLVRHAYERTFWIHLVPRYTRL